MTKISEELAATAKWLSNPETMKRCRSDGHSTLLCYTDKSNLIITGAIGGEDVNAITMHVIKTLMENIEPNDRHKYINYIVLNLLEIRMEEELEHLKEEE